MTVVDGGAPAARRADTTGGKDTEDTEDTQGTSQRARGEDPTHDRTAHEHWRLVVVSGVAMDLPSAYPEVILRESVTPYRELRIPVGLAEGTAIAHAWRGIATPRPLTHELAVEILTRHDVTIEGVRITERRGKVFYAEIDTMGPRGHHVISCRPSDAIALALRHPLPTPMLVAEDVLSSDEETGGWH